MRLERLGASGGQRRLLHDEDALAQQGFACGGGVYQGGAQAQQAGAFGGAGEEVAELFELNAQHGGQFAAAGGVARLGGGIGVLQHGAAQAQLGAQGLLHQLHGRLGPAGQGVGAQLLGVGVVQAVQHGGAAF